MPFLVDLERAFLFFGIKLPNRKRLTTRFYTERSLAPGEHIICSTKLHPILLLGPFILFLVALLFTIITFIYGGKLIFLGLLALAIAPFPLINAYVKRTTTEYSLTNRRLIFKSGVLRTLSKETNLKSIMAISLDQSIFGRIYDFGTITINCVASVQHFVGIAHPLELKYAIENAINPNSRPSAVQNNIIVLVNQAPKDPQQPVEPIDYQKYMY